MNIERLHNTSGELVVRLSGEFDALGTTAVRPEFERIAEQEEVHVVVDMTGVTFMDSSGVGAIVFLFKRLRAAQRKLSLTGVHGQARELLELLRVDKAVPVSLLDGVDGGGC